MKDLKILDKISTEISNECILVITGYKDLRVYKVMADLMDINFRNYNTRQLLGYNVESKYKNSPVFIVTDSIGNILL